VPALDERGRRARRLKIVADPLAHEQFDQGGNGHRPFDVLKDVADQDLDLVVGGQPARLHARPESFVQNFHPTVVDFHSL